LAEFPSVVDAVRCAVEVQRGMAERNAEAPPERRIEFRVGINLGDVIVEGGDIYGDGVNMATRLEALAEPGGICVSRVVRDQVRSGLSVVGIVMLMVGPLRLGAKHILRSRILDPKEPVETVREPGRLRESDRS
jgi:class 3 adenylate cyclase